MSTAAADAVMVAWQGFASAEGAFPRGTRVRASHPAVVNHPEFFVADGTPESEWPSYVDVLVAGYEERERVEREERERAFGELARLNPVSFERPQLVVATEDFAAWHEGRAALVRKGSVLVADSPLAREYAAHFKPTK